MSANSIHNNLVRLRLSRPFRPIRTIHLDDFALSLAKLLSGFMHLFILGLSRRRADGSLEDDLVNGGAVQVDIIKIRAKSAPDFSA
jgi:hypothetical protein